MGLETLALPAGWRTRPGTWDLNLWDCIVIHNEYDLTDRYNPWDVCIDVGAHIGCFSWLAAEHGFGQVFAYEVDLANFALLEENVAPLGNVHASNAAVWRSDRQETVHLAQCHDAVNTGGHSVCGDLAGTVEISNVIAFDDVVYQACASTSAGRVRLVKMDAEGSEFPILYTATTLDLIDEIKGEYHNKISTPEHLAEFSFQMSDLARHLQNSGFEVTTRSTGDYLGLFHAVRRDGHAL